MEPEFWKQAWAEGRTRFNEGVANAFLVEYAAKLTGRVLVPLCGKAEDVAYLASLGHEVVGVELVEDAVAAFFAEHGLSPDVDEPFAEGGHRTYRAGAVTLIAGDWFGVTRDMVGTVGSVYDRAALIALPAELRVKYIAHQRAILAPGTPGLLIAVDYPPDRFQGPPFPVVDAEVRTHYAAAELLVEKPAVGGRMAEVNIGAVERCYATTL